MLSIAKIFKATRASYFILALSVIIFAKINTKYKKYLYLRIQLETREIFKFTL